MRSKLNAFLLLILLSTVGCMSPKLLTENAADATRDLLDKQMKSWNKGDMPGFMEAYWKSDSLQFVGSNGITYGWQNTLMNYQRTYPDKETMGKLTYDVLSVKPIGSNHAYVTGKWNLDRRMGNKSGYFTLLLRRLPEGWRIVADHSS